MPPNTIGHIKTASIPNRPISITPLLKYLLGLGDNEKVVTHFNKNMINNPTERHYCSVIKITDNLKKEFKSVGVNIV